MQVNKGNWRKHYVNGHGFTVGLATFAVFIIGSVLLGASMLVSGTAKEVQELAPAPKEYQVSAYGAKHSGVGFANYVVGNAVSSFWNKEMGKKGTSAKMTDPFASFLLKKKNGKKGTSSDSTSDETPEQQADDAQPIDEGMHTRTHTDSESMEAQPSCLHVRMPQSGVLLHTERS